MLALSYTRVGSGLGTEVSELAQAQADDISCPIFVHWFCYSIIRVHQIGQAWFNLGEDMLAVWDHLLGCALTYFPGGSDP